MSVIGWALLLFVIPILIFLLLYNISFKDTKGDFCCFNCGSRKLKSNGVKLVCQRCGCDEILKND